MIESVLECLQLPNACLTTKRITKVFFKQNLDLTSAERALLDNPSLVSAIDIIASIKPDTANIAAVVTDEATYEEILVIALATTDEGIFNKSNALTDLVQKHIPYHILLVLYTPTHWLWNLCYKKVNQNNANKRIIEKKLSTPAFSIQPQDPNQQAFLNALSFNGLPKVNLELLYNGYGACFVGLMGANIGGVFLRRPVERTKADILLIDKINSLEIELNTLIAQAKKETQLSQQIAINKTLQEKRTLQQQLKNSLNQL